MTPIVLPIKVFLTLTGYLLMSIVLGTTVDYLGIWLGWWDHTHQLHILAADIQYLGDNFTVSVFGQPPAELALAIGQTIKSYLTFSTQIHYQEFYFFRLAKTVLEIVEPYWQNLIYSAMSVAVRVFIILMSIIFFIVVFIVAAVDGLVERELRKEAGGLEYAKVYHHAKIWIRRVLIVSPIIYLSYPESINPAFIILPAASSLWLATLISFATYKKYL